MSEQSLNEAYQEWKESYALIYEPDYTKEHDVDCRLAFEAGVQYVLDRLKEFYGN